jgi:hypothetical protein
MSSRHRQSSRENHPPSCILLRSPPMPKTPLGEFVISSHPHRSRPYWEMSSVGAAPLTLVRSAMAPPRRLVHATAALSGATSHPCHDERLGLEERKTIWCFRSRPSKPKPMVEIRSRSPLRPMNLSLQIGEWAALILWSCMDPWTNHRERGLWDFL